MRTAATIHIPDSLTELESRPPRRIAAREVKMIFSPTTPREEILRTCRLLMAPGAVHEIRLPNAGSRGTIAGYFDDAERLEGESVKVDAIPPATLRSIARDCIQSHVDAERLSRLQMSEEQDRSDLERIIETWESRS